jgi:hypothetical protein
MTVGPKGIGFVASDQTSGRLIHIQLVPNDLLHFQLYVESAPFRCTLETSSIHAVFHQLKRRDTVVLYATVTGAVGTLVDYSGKRSHTKHSTICVNPSQSPEYQIPSGYHTNGVATSSAILQRILREYSRASTAVMEDRPQKHQQARGAHR